MYGLFNSSDRGSIKNYHIINTRKGHCEVEIKFSVGGKNYKLQRQSVKRQLKSGKTHSVTNLNLFELDLNGEEIFDLCGEQRKDTDKVIESLIGKKEDFLMTSFSSQGDMHHFLSKGPIQRMATLNNFLDLRLFDVLYKNCREESSLVRGKVQKFPNKDWEKEISESKNNIKLLKEKHQILKKEISSLRSKKEDLSFSLATNENRNIITSIDVDSHRSSIEEITKEISELNENIFSNLTKIKNSQNLMKKFKGIKEAFPIHELESLMKKLAQDDKKLSILSSKLTYENQKLESINSKLQNCLNKIKMLEDHKYDPDCVFCCENKFVKDAKNATNLIPEIKLNIEGQEGVIIEITHDKKLLTKEVANLKRKKISDKIKKYNAMIQREQEEKENILNLKNNNNLLTIKLNAKEISLEKLNEELSEMIKNISDDKEYDEIKSLKSKISEISNKIIKGEKISNKCVESIGDNKSKLNRLITDKKEYDLAMEEWKVWDLITKSFSKKGIPNSILTSQLPKINSEIKKILQGVVNFIVELQDTGNGIEIYINYGDSKRVIECSSGMEKMISSIAIRVALINISTLPKSDMFIVDEGFGALDASNVESCGRLLKNLKKWFKTIIIISHVDGIKDSVDKILEITSEGKDSKVIYE